MFSPWNRSSGSRPAFPTLVFALSAIAFGWIALSSTPPPRQPTQAKAHPIFHRVLIVSIDGFRPDAIKAAGPDKLPAIHALLKGPHTLNARTDPDYTITLPNHTGMITGRFTSGPAGHNWVDNVDPPRDATLHNRHGQYIASIFDVAHDHGLHTALLAGKTKFSLWNKSYDELNGAPDLTGPDDGQDKIDDLFFGTSAQIARQSIELLTQNQQQRSFQFVHFAITDAAGHAAGWDLSDGSRYLIALAQVDSALSLMLSAIQESDHLRDTTAIIVTSDHGGGAPYTSHTVSDDPLNYIIPFIVWLGPDLPATDLYGLNDQARHDPGDRLVPADDRHPPIRNSDAANLAAFLLDLPSVPGATVNADSDLRVRP